MALDGTITKISAVDVADGETLVLDVQGPSDYDGTEGGEDLLPAAGFRTGGLRLDAAEGRALDPANGYAKLDGTTGLVQLFTAADVEQINAFDASAFTYRLTVHGR